MNTADILDRAADVIKERGWYRSGFAPSHSTVDLITCEVCVLGAINVAVGRLPIATLDSRTIAAGKALAEHLGMDLSEDALPTHEAVIDAVGEHWNDEVATSAEQVVTALRECAADLRSRS